MKSWRITEGDLDINRSQRVDMVQGRDKLVQDLSLWLLEPLGIGYTTPNFGSLLNYAEQSPRGQGHFIGRGLDEQRASEVEAEVDRILNLYQQDQIQKIRQAQIEGRLYLYRRSEILDSINEVASKIDRDAMTVRASFTTGANVDVDLIAAVDDEEAEVIAT